MDALPWTLAGLFAGFSLGLLLAPAGLRPTRDAANGRAGSTFSRPHITRDTFAPSKPVIDAFDGQLPAPPKPTADEDFTSAPFPFGDNAPRY